MKDQALKVARGHGGPGSLDQLSILLISAQVMISREWDGVYDQWEVCLRFSPSALPQLLQALSLFVALYI